MHDDENEIAPLRLVSKLRNNRMIRAREKLGLTGIATAELIGISQADWSALESMRVSPLRKNGQWRKAALAIADWFKCMPEDLWPAEALAVENNKVELEIGVDEAQALMGRGHLGELQAAFTEIEAQRLEEALETLTPREQRVLRAIYGLDGEPPKTLSAVAAMFDVCTERARQIQFKGLRKLRHPSRANLILGTTQHRINLPDESIVRCDLCEAALTRKSLNDPFTCACPWPKGKQGELYREDLRAEGKDRDLYYEELRAIDAGEIIK